MSRCSDELHLRALSGDIEARNEVVLANLPLADGYAKRNWRRLYLDPWEVSAAARYGLVLAASRFDPKRGTKFSTMAHHWMRKTCLEAVCNAGAGSVIDGKARRRGLGPSGLVRESAGILLDHEATVRADTILAAIDDQDEFDWRLASLRAALSKLPKIEQKAFRLRHGLGGEPPMSCSQVAARIGGTKQAAIERSGRAMDKVLAILGRSA